MKHYLRSEAERGTLSRAADALGCQRSLLSRVMNSHVHITPDQAYSLTEFLRFSPMESEYFHTLVEFERASGSSYRGALEAKLARLRKASSDLSDRIQRPPPKFHELDAATYFSGWTWSAIHFLTSSKRYQTIEAISARLTIPLKLVEQILRRLEEMGMVRQERSKWIYHSGEFHLPKDSPYVCMHHSNWRQRAALSAQAPNGDGIHFTNVQTISRKDLETLRNMVLKFIGECKAVVDPSEPEEAIALTVDLFPL
jgi:uncharacterized protein (TIGR02147 family)